MKKKKWLSIFLVVCLIGGIGVASGITRKELMGVGFHLCIFQRS